MARNAAAACCSAAVLLLAVSVYAAGDDATGPLAAAPAPDLTSGVEETSILLPVHHDSDDKEVDEDVEAGRHRGASAGDVASLATAGEEGEEIGSDWGEPKKLDDDSDSDSDDDSDSESDSDSDSESDSDDEEDNNSRKEARSIRLPGGASGGLHDDKQPKMVIKM